MKLSLRPAIDEIKTFSRTFVERPRFAMVIAIVLTMAAGTELLAIQSIVYSRGEPVFEVRPMNRMMAAKGAMVEEASMDGGSYDLDVEPDDIEVFDTVTIVWEIA